MSICIAKKVIFRRFVKTPKMYWVLHINVRNFTKKMSGILDPMILPFRSFLASLSKGSHKSFTSLLISIKVSIDIQNSATCE